MEAVVLAGGLGTRLRHVVSDVPKPMAPINGEPFMKYIFEYLIKNAATRIILAVGYKHEIIQEYFGNSYKGVPIVYSVEDKPLGTGGAIKQAFAFCQNENVAVINGDTYYDVDLTEMFDFHLKKQAEITVAVKPMKNFERYGCVVIENGLIKCFDEKKPTKYGKINGGIYVLKKSIFGYVGETAFSFEKSVLESKSAGVYAFESDGYFIDIGVPEDYCRAQDELKKFYAH
ncbi:MAG: nucleotidyltransferase family protein [Clostridia bacterium]|nr:nucleotidyltransferase family protein [Clostridia bacterium]